MSENKKLLLIGVLSFVLLMPICYFLIGQFSIIYTTPIHEQPVKSATDRFIRKISYVPFGGIFKRQINYYWYAPEHIDPNTKLPLVIILHGGTGYSYAGRYLTQEPIASQFPAFVMVPMIPKGAVWSYPKFTRNINDLDNVVKAVKDLANEQPIDFNRIYVVGCSMGGYGVFGASMHYDDFFAAGISISGDWNPKHANQMTKMPMIVMAGSYDKIVPFNDTYAVYEAMANAGAPVRFVEYNMGHNCPSEQYYSENVWAWLFDKRLH